jgi:hypothetical protein
MSWFSRKKWDGKIPDSWPIFADGRQALARWTHPDLEKQVFIVLRPDGRFSKHSQLFSEEEFEWCWLPDETGGSLHDTAATAEQNIFLEYSWAAQVKKEANQPPEPMPLKRHGSP